MMLQVGGCAEFGCSFCGLRAVAPLGQPSCETGKCWLGEYFSRGDWITIEEWSGSGFYMVLYLYFVGGLSVFLWRNVGYWRIALNCLFSGSELSDGWLNYGMAGQVWNEV